MNNLEVASAHDRIQSAINIATQDQSNHLTLSKVLKDLVPEKVVQVADILDAIDAEGVSITYEMLEQHLLEDLEESVGA